MCLFEANEAIMQDDGLLKTNKKERKPLESLHIYNALFSRPRDWNSEFFRLQVISLAWAPRHDTLFRPWISRVDTADMWTS